MDDMIEAERGRGYDHALTEEEEIYQRFPIPPELDAALATPWIGLKDNPPIELTGIEKLVAICTHGTDIEKENASSALWGMAGHAENKVTIAQCGGIEILMNLAWNGKNVAIKENGMGVLGRMSRKSPENKEAIREAGGVAMLIEVALTGFKRLKIEALAALKDLTTDSPTNEALVVAAGIALSDLQV
jgi:hypothetical protein